MSNNTKVSLQKMYVTLIEGSQKTFKPGDIISNGKETKIATNSSNFFNFKNWGFERKDLVIASVSKIIPNQLAINSIVSIADQGKIIGFETVAKTNLELIEANVNTLKIEAWTGESKEVSLPKISKDFINLFLNKEGGIRVTNVVVNKTGKNTFVPKLDENSCVITKPVFKFKRFKK